MKISKRQLTISIVSLAILLASIVFLLLDVLLPIGLWTHPALNFFFVMFLGFGVLSLVLGFSNSSPWFFFLSGLQLGLCIVYALIQYVDWWVAVLVAVGIWIIFAIISFIKAGNKTEEIAMNTSPDYKNYQQRKAEKAELEASKQPEELPTLKSFKE